MFDEDWQEQHRSIYGKDRATQRKLEKAGVDGACLVGPNGEIISLEEKNPDKVGAESGQESKTNDEAKIAKSEGDVNVSDKLFGLLVDLLPKRRIA